MTIAVELDPERRAAIGRRVQVLAWVTIGYNTIEGVVAIAVGVAAGSVALLSFGLDSLVEVLSALAVSWQFAGRGASHEEREARTLKLVALAFFALAAYVSIDALGTLIAQEQADKSLVGIGVAVTSLIVMPVLTFSKRRAGRRLGSRAVVADSMQTLLCVYLSGVLLLGLVLDAALGWWWADPVAALVIALVAAREGLETWRGDAQTDRAPDLVLHRSGARSTGVSNGT